MSIFRLDDKVALVTGGYGHLGASLCRGLADFGATVYALGRSAEKFTAQLADHPTIHFLPVDVADTAAVRASFERIYHTHQRLDVLINNAFYVRGQSPLALSDVEWAETSEGVLGTVYRCIREVAPYLQRQQGGKIINISSMYGLVAPDFAIYDTSPAFLNPPHYGAAKAAVIQLTRYFAHYLGTDNIQVNAISPGPFPNETVQQDRAFVEALQRKTALKRLGQPADLVGAAVFLSSAASDFVTGHNLVVDGGWTAA